MRPADLLALAGGALRGHGVRTVLSLSGMAIGVAAVLVLTALGEGARGYVRGEFAALGSDLLGIVPGRTETTGAIPGIIGGVPNDLTLADARAIVRALPGTIHAAPMVVGSDEVSRGSRRRTAVVLGTAPAFLQIRDLAVRSGAFLPDLPWERGASVIVLGARLADELFPGANPLGGTVRLAGWRLRVVGVMERRGTQLGMDMDETAFVPVATAMKVFDRSSLFRLAVRLRPGADLAAAEARVLDVIAERHGEVDVTVVTQDAVLGALSRILGALTAALAGIAAISLAVAGIGIMNVMLVSVAERTSEIGLLKALGAAPGQVLGLFLAEAALLSMAGGAAGVALGALAVRVLVLLWPVFPASTPLWATTAALGLALTVGTVFGVLPARRASALDPVEALAGR